MRQEKLLLALVLLVAVAVRLYAVLALPFEQDELYTIYEATALFDSQFSIGIHTRPLFFLLEHGIVTSLPHTPLVLRGLPFLFGIAGVVTIWALARSAFGPRAALVTAFLVSISPWHMGVSSFGRYYSLLFLLASLVYLFLPAAYDKDRPRDYLIAMVAMLAGAFTHPSFVFPVAAAGLVVMAVGADGRWRWRWPTRNGWRFLWLPFLSISAMAFVLIRVLYGPDTMTGAGSRGILASLRLLPAIVEWITPVLCVAAGIGILALLVSGSLEGEHDVTGPRRRIALMAAAGVLGTGAALFALSFVATVFADYAVAALPLVFVGAGGLIAWLQNGAGPVRQSRIAIAGASLLAAGLLPSTVSFLSDGSRFDYRPAFARIEREGPDVAVVTWPIVLQQTYAPRLRAFEMPPTAEALGAILEREGEIWAVISVKRYGVVEDGDGKLARWLSDRCRIVDQFQRPRVDYRMYRVDLWRCRSIRSQPEAHPTSPSEIRIPSPERLRADQPLVAPANSSGDGDPPGSNFFERHAPEVLAIAL